MKKEMLKMSGALFIGLLLFVNVKVTFFESNSLDLASLSLMDVVLAEGSGSGEDWWNPPKPGQVGKLDPCVLHFPDGSFMSSVEYVCYDNYVCPSCTCTPDPCGD